MFVSVAGNIGSGKSSLTSLLYEKFGWKPYFESVDDNPYLEDFYSDMKRWSFHSQIYFLSRRFILHRDIIQRRGNAVQDRSVYEDAEIFAKNLHSMGMLDERDYTNYRALYDAMTAYLTPPNLLIYLRCSVPTLLQQICVRGREFEKNIDAGYLGRLNALYEEWITSYASGKTLIIDLNEMDYIRDPQRREELLYRIDRAVRARA